ncbi:hypothetical protein COU80_03810 [Candidatus Peregrinibacteria bacterium CG10_big_fil_rev_8_21_14_0_10_55_24]|nr:MAG: hypothetical protein COU80_03810 [Candidatus Peregrinibacteria bacterium CG10_big_fil_rev_8_21_14_0_10_55_24]
MLTILIPSEGESWGALKRRLQQVEGEVFVVLGIGEGMPPVGDERGWRDFLDACARMSDRVYVATLHRAYAVAGRSHGIRIVDRVADVRDILQGHPSIDEVLRVLSPHLWQQQLRSRLQTMGLLSLPKLRIWLLIGLSSFLLYFVLFKLLPSAEIRVTPRQDTVTQTANIFLVLSGATVEIPPRVRTLELIPLSVTARRSITFDQISKEFTGTNAKVAMTIVNKFQEKFSLRKNSRLANQAGMLFLLSEQVFIDPGDQVTVEAVAADLDLYGEIIGERGNVPAGLKWEFVGLPKEDRVLVYGENKEPAIGGTTQYENILKQEDLTLAEKQLKQELLAIANQIIDEERTLYNATQADSIQERLYYDEFTTATYSGFMLPTQFLGEHVSSVPVEGSIIFTAYAYDKYAALTMLRKELFEHVEEGKHLLEDSVTMDRLVHHVIDYADDLSWIKLTVDLSGKDQYVLDPLTPSGARFAMQVRKLVAGATPEEAQRIVKNLQEVESVEVSLWPPWSRALPTIPSHITITALPASES